MRLKLDENITVVAKDLLVALGHDVDTVPDEQLVGRPDPDVLAAAVADERALVTFDLGFGDPRGYPPGSHRGVILLRLRDQQPDNVVTVLQGLAENHDLNAGRLHRRGRRAIDPNPLAGVKAGSPTQPQPTSPSSPLDSRPKFGEGRRSNGRRPSSPQVTGGDVDGREVDHIADTALSYAEVKALATGNPLIMEKVAVDAEVARLVRLQRAHADEQHRLRRALEASQRQEASLLR